MTNQTVPEAINVFIQRLIEEKKFENQDAEVLAQIKNDLTERVEDRINATILENMPPGKLMDFDQIMDSEDMEKIQAFCQANIPDLENIIAQALVEFRNTYLNS